MVWMRGGMFRRRELLVDDLGGKSGENVNQNSFQVKLRRTIFNEFSGFEIVENF